MKILVGSLLAVSAFALSTAADAPSLSGKWKVFTSIAGNDSDMDCTFAQKDDALTGSCVSPRGTVDIGGKVDGDKVGWSYKSEYNGMPLTVQYTGAKASATMLKGTVNVPEYGVGGDFTDNRAE